MDGNGLRIKGGYASLVSAIKFTAPKKNGVPLARYSISMKFDAHGRTNLKRYRWEFSGTELYGTIRS